MSDFDLWVAGRPFFDKDETTMPFERYVHQSLAADPYEGGRLEQLETQVRNMEDLVTRLLGALKERVLLDDNTILNDIVWNHFIDDARFTKSHKKEK